MNLYLRLLWTLLRSGRLAPRGLDGELSGTGLAARLFRLAQRRSEGRDRTNRAQVLRQDDWIDKHLPGVG